MINDETFPKYLILFAPDLKKYPFCVLQHHRLCLFCALCIFISKMSCKDNEEESNTSPSAIRLNLNQSGELGLEQAATETGEPCDSDKDFEPSPPQNKRKAMTKPSSAKPCDSDEDFELSSPQKKRKAMTKPSSAKKTKVTRYRGGNYSTEEITSLLQLIEDTLPISSSEWATLARMHLEKFKECKRDETSIKKKFQKLWKKECLLGIPIALLISEQQNKSC